MKRIFALALVALSCGTAKDHSQLRITNGHDIPETAYPATVKVVAMPISDSFVLKLSQFFLIGFPLASALSMPKGNTHDSIRCPS